MSVLLVAVCLVVIGSIANVLSYWPSLKEQAKAVFQLVGIGTVGVGAILGFWSALIAAGRNGLFVPLMFLFFIAVAVMAVVAFFSRERLASRIPRDDPDKHNQYEYAEASADHTVLYCRTDRSELTYHSLRVTLLRSSAPKTPQKPRGTAAPTPNHT
jgi:hypothetical protein